MLKFKFEDELFDNLEDAEMAVMEAHPELLDDEMPDFFDDNIEEVEDSDVDDKLISYVEYEEK